MLIMIFQFILFYSFLCYLIHLYSPVIVATCFNSMSCSIKDFNAQSARKRAERRNKNQIAAAASVESRAQSCRSSRRRLTEAKTRRDLRTPLVSTVKHHDASPTQYIHQQESCAIVNLETVTEMMIYFAELCSHRRFCESCRWRLTTESVQIEYQARDGATIAEFKCTRCSFVVASKKLAKDMNVPGGDAANFDANGEEEKTATIEDACCPETETHDGRTKPLTDVAWRTVYLELLTGGGYRNIVKGCHLGIRNYMSRAYYDKVALKITPWLKMYGEESIARAVENLKAGKEIVYAKGAHDTSFPHPRNSVYVALCPQAQF